MDITSVTHSLNVSSQGHFTSSNSRKSIGRITHRSRFAKDLAVLFDADPSVESWASQRLLHSPVTMHIPDFHVRTRDGSEFYADAPDRNGAESAERFGAYIAALGMSYRLYRMQEVYDGFRLRNSRDLMRYARYIPTLGDRIRLLSGLEEHGTLSLAECLTAFQEGTAIPSLAALYIQGWIEIDLDSELIGPETRIRRFRL